jgi:hypothetical protein
MDAAHVWEEGLATSGVRAATELLTNSVAAERQLNTTVKPTSSLPSLPSWLPPLYRTKLSILVLLPSLDSAGR